MKIVKTMKYLCEEIYKKYYFFWENIFIGKLCVCVVFFFGFAVTIYGRYARL